MQCKQQLTMDIEFKINDTCMYLTSTFEYLLEQKSKKFFEAYGYESHNKNLLQYLTRDDNKENPGGEMLLLCSEKLYTYPDVALLMQIGDVVTTEAIQTKYSHTRGVLQLMQYCEIQFVVELRTFTGKKLEILLTPFLPQFSDRAIKNALRKI